MMNLAFAVIGLLICPFSINAQIFLTDDFDSNNIDTSKWHVNLPFDNDFVIDRYVTSSATQNSGSLMLKGGASINSKANIVGPYQVSGIFNQSSPGGTTIITLRGDGISSDPTYGGPNGSILLGFFGDSSWDPNYKCGIGIASSPYAWNWNINEIYRDNNFPLLHNSPTSFHIIDWGNLLEITINNILISKVSLSTGGFGNSVTVASQWSDNSGLHIESLQIESVPEPSALSLLAVGLGVVLWRRRRTV